MDGRRKSLLGLLLVLTVASVIGIFFYLQSKGQDIPTEPALRKFMELVDAKEKMP